MSKVLGFTKNGGEDWFNSSEYGNKEIQGIPDPEGGHALNSPTSIPSPFARMDLVRKSFESICESPTLEFLQKGRKVLASREDEKLVSQCLDLAEILFFFNNYKNKIEILEWNRITQINSLKGSQDTGHVRLGEVLELYLSQDAKSFNFDDMKSVYIIKYNHKVIGGTSPLTLFFSVGNDNSHLDLKSNTGKVFFKDIVPLYKRDTHFQTYLYLLFKNNGHFGTKMKAYNEYLNKNLQVLSTKNPELFNKLNSLNTSDLATNYIDLNTRNAGQVVEVLGVSLKTINPAIVTSNIQKSDFVIHSTKITVSDKPLALQNNFNKSIRYINSNWDSKTKVPYKDEKDIASRILPGQDIAYPYLTVSDFLEPHIIRLVYPINSKKYFDGNVKFNKPGTTYSFLLPLKPLFFEYFNSEDLVFGGIGKPEISIDETAVASSVRVQLKIPIKTGTDFVVFERIYHNEGIADEMANKGGITEHQLGVTIFPFIKYNPDTTPIYNVQLIDRDVQKKVIDYNWHLQFFSNASNRPINVDSESYRNRKLKGDLSKFGSSYYGLSHQFDYIQVDNQFAKGMIIPKWMEIPNVGKKFSFAIDFGTTNTHIEYSIDNGAPMPFEISKGEEQAFSLVDESIEHNFSGTGAIDIRASVVKEFIPEIIKSNSLYNFPQRTVISQSLLNGPQAGGKALVDFNIPFIFEKNTDNNSTFYTNLKWNGKVPNNEYRVKAFLEQLVMIIRNKVLISGGDLPSTKIIWTYPTSMSIARINGLQNTWNELYSKYISDTGKPVSICESVAPYYYFQGNAKLEGLGYGTSVLMDIGGGTSDVVVYKNNEPKLISSYKFAGNALFGDGYKEFANIQSNGLINRFKGEFDELLDGSYKTLKSISDELYVKQDSADFNTFLFSLANNYEVKDGELVDYNRKLGSESDIKIIFLYFYCAKIYHMAQLMKVNKMDLPMNMVFSGNGSKILNIVSTDEKVLSKLTQNIFLSVYNLKNYPDHGLKMTVEKHFPKAVTSKGALIHHKQDAQDYDIKNLKVTLTCLEDESLNTLLYSELSDEVLNKIISKVEDFNNSFILLNEVMDFEEYFDVSVSSFSKFKSIINLHLKAFLKAGLEHNRKMDGDAHNPNSPISDSPFFYPIIESIQQLITELLPKRAAN